MASEPFPPSFDMFEGVGIAGFVVSLGAKFMPLVYPALALLCLAGVLSSLVPSLFAKMTFPIRYRVNRYRAGVSAKNPHGRHKKDWRW